MMGALENSRQERFAQGLAMGLTKVQAYAEAGYRGAPPAASRLSKTPRIQARVAEILERAAARAEISVGLVTENLVRIACKAEDLSGAPGLGVARATRKDAAKLNGQLSERPETPGSNVKWIISDRPLTEEEWMEQYGVGVVEDGGSY
jgi:phage terminase small subunit